MEPRDGSSHDSFGEWHEGCRQQYPECNETTDDTPAGIAQSSEINANENARVTPTRTAPNQTQRHLTQTEQSFHLAQANTPNSASFLEPALFTKRAAVIIAQETQDKLTAMHTNEPIVERAENTGMLTKRDNTTASEFSDIEHQPGPELSASNDTQSRPPSPERAQGYRNERDCELCEIVTEFATVTCGS